MRQGTRGFVLSQADQTKITYLLTNFAKSEPNVLKYSQTVNLLLDRCVFNNKFTLVEFHLLFQAALQVKSTKPIEKTEVQGERIIVKQQLIFLLEETGKILYKPDPNYLERFYSNFLSEKMEIQNGQINRSRVMVVDDLAKKLITQEAVQQFCLYSQELKHIFIAYTIQNYWSLKRKRRLLLTFREMLLQNKKWSYLSLILFLKQSQTTPHLVTIEHVQQFLRSIIPNTNQRQQQFYSKHIITDSYHKDLDGADGSTHQGDPGIMLFEFQLLIIRLAWDSHPKDLQKKDIGMVLQRYLKYLYLRKNGQLNEQPLPSINRKMINTMKQYYKVINNEVHVDNDTKEGEKDNMTLFQRLAKKMQKELTEAPQLDTDFVEVGKILDRQLPKMPPLPVVEKEYTGKYDKNFAITLGKQPPPQPVEKNDKPKAEKKDAGKKDEIPPRVFQWAAVPEVKLSTEEYMKQIDQKLNFQIKPLSDISRGVIPKEGYPVIITEILFPPELPKSVVPYIEQANNALSERNFILALESLSNAANAWKKTSVQFDAVAELFISYSKGNIYMAAGQIEYGLVSFYNCRKLVDTSKLPFNNPDRSLPFFGLGQVFYEMQEYQIAARCFLKAREIRQNVLGLEHVQTATVFNNLACCFFMLGRAQQSLGYIQIAQVVLDTELGAHHERTMTSRNNLKKITRGTFDNQPAFKKFWEVFEEDQFEKKKKKKKDEGGKKGKK